jgi:Protein of unknown function (DUF1203)
MIGRCNAVSDRRQRAAAFVATIVGMHATAITPVRISGADPDRLAELWERGVDHGGNVVEPFVDDDGGWPLRCCLTDSKPGDELAIVAWAPFEWRGPYAEVGPIVIHGRPCAGVTTDGVPPQFLERRQLVRPYGYDRRIAYDDIVIVEADGSLPDVLADVLSRDGIELALVRNVDAGCYSFTATRAPSPA